MHILLEFNSKMSTATKRTVLLQLLLVGGMLYAKPEESIQRKVNYTLCDGDCLNKHGSLEIIAATNHKGQDVFVDIKIPHINLNINISFHRLQSLTIIGDSDSPTIIDCTQMNNKFGAGIKIDNVITVELRDLVLTQCGAQVESNKSYMYRAALAMLSCSNVTINNLNVTKSQGMGLTIFSHHKGNVHITASNFIENRISKESVMDKIRGGGGIYIGRFQKQCQSLLSFKFEDCIFANNVAHKSRYQDFNTDEFGEPRSGYGRGGGAFIEYKGQIEPNCNVTVSFTRCRFIQNSAFLGGGLSISIRKVVKPQIKVTMKDSLFESNGCDNVTNTSMGGGAHLSYETEECHDSEYNFQNVTFANNCAELGGGIFFFSSKQKSSGCSLVFDNCAFDRNEAHTGSAIDMTPNINSRLTTGHTNIVPAFKNCTFTNNKVNVNSNSDNTQMIEGIGTLYSSLYDIRFEGYNHFENNAGTPVYMVNGNANFARSSVTFKSNRGIRGGAIALIGTSSMTVGPNKEYNFVDNVAQYQGGAIFTLMIDSHDFTISKSCFIQYIDDNNKSLTKDWNNNITFTGNNATFGNAIFTTSLHPCQIISKNDSCIHITRNNEEVFSHRGIHINERDISTEGAHLYHKKETLHAIPGKRYDHGVKIHDDLNNSVSQPLTIRIDSNEVKIDADFSSFTRKMIQLTGNPHKRANLTLQTVSTREIYTTLEVQLEQCPPGFDLEMEKCYCKVHKYFGLIDYCDNDNYRTYLTPGLWAGLVNENEIATSVCPYSFCKYKIENSSGIIGIPLPQNRNDLDKVICGEKNRTGILCGSCTEGHVVHFHSPRFRCNKINQALCKGGWLFYILSELVPVTVVFVIVLVLNISFTSGAVNGFILFSQVLLSLNIDASGIITYPNQRATTEGYQLLYGFLNLEFFTTETLSFCLWTKATALDMLAFKYVTIIYSLSLVILIIWFMNTSGGNCLGKWYRITKVKSSVVHGISAFLIICYSQSIFVSHSLVNGVELWHREGSNTTTPKKVWLDGRMTYFSRDHLPYAILALLCLSTIGIFPPILLLAYPLSNKVLTLFGLEETKLVTYISQKLPISNLKPLLDCFQSCFKDNLRFFAGLYFLYRWAAPVVYTISSDLGTAYTITEILLILMLVLHALFQPYQKRVHNVVDTLLFTNLFLINSITCVHYYLFQRQENESYIKERVAKTAAVQMLLIYLPITTMLFYLLGAGSKRIIHFWNRSKENFNEDIELPTTHKLRRLKAAVHSIRSMGGDANDNELPHRLIAGEVSYECLEDVDRARETYAEAKSAEDAVTY